ncbi:hypothetical protein H2C43_07195 [Corynebacterium glutamicum]|uniref:Uncharacterized protein n=2 Tax=Bacteria TaxID=2 RepID=Q8NPE1_CORGL|nr:hypothetical protein [Corynebacterium glutamicum]AUI01352.1 hypothetical protein CYL77_09460 [Corynebacterium glutamicum]AUI05000.1 hypothetical protein C0I99_13155 [Corynebacterium glutamicum]MBA4571793.1 hypothetical protein [Corynebacterium glutamicum]MBA4574728.1 hypothetical protein [Corynebacterium glutamicum]MBA4577657.1 hypothetical protein [Corynebacterium glutamicum]
MSNNALLVANEADIGLYLHWNGGRDSIEAFLAYAAYAQLPPINENNDWLPPFITVLKNFFGNDGSGVYLEPVNQDYLDGIDYDNGVYMLDDYEITERINPPAVEQDSHDLHDMLIKIDKAQPPVDQLGSFLHGLETSVADLGVGDRVFLPRFSTFDKKLGRYRIHTVLGFAENDPFNPMTSSERFKGKPYVDMFDNQDNAFNPNSYITTDTVRIVVDPVPETNPDDEKAGR